MRRVILGFALLLASLSTAFAQQTNGLCTWSLVNNVKTCTDVSAGHPLPVTASVSLAVSPVTTAQVKLTVAVTNTYQQALASNASRNGCTIQYIAVAGTKGYVFFGASPSDTTTSFQLQSGQAINCAVGGLAVATDAVQVTGTGTDIFVISSQ